MPARRSWSLSLFLLQGACFDPGSADTGASDATGTGTDTGAGTDPVTSGEDAVAESSGTSGGAVEGTSGTAVGSSGSSSGPSPDGSSSGSTPVPGAPQLDARATVDGVRLTLQLDVADADADLEDVVVVWGDGEAETIPATDGALRTAVTHDYESLETFSLVVTATDAAGQSDLHLEDIVVAVPGEAELEYRMATDPFEGVPDTSGNGRDGWAETSDDCTAPTTDRHGLAERAWSFNVEGGSCEVDAFGRIEAPHVPHTSEFSFSIWVDPRQPDGFIMGQTNTNAFEASWARLIVGEVDALGTSNQLSFVVEDAAGAPHAVTDPDPLDRDSGTWTHVAGVVSFDGTESTATLYRDGEAVGTPVVLSGTLNNPSDEHPFLIGDQSPEGGFAWYQGGLDDARVYDRALSPFEIRALVLE